MKFFRRPEPPVRKCIVDSCDKPSEPQGLPAPGAPFCHSHSWDDYPARDTRECGWFGCHHPRCEIVCAGLSLKELQSWKNADMRLPGEAYCADCPDREACATGYPCWKVKEVELQYQARVQAEAVVWTVDYTTPGFIRPDQLTD